MAGTDIIFAFPLVLLGGVMLLCACSGFFYGFGFLFGFLISFKDEGFAFSNFKYLLCGILILSYCFSFFYGLGHFVEDYTIKEFKTNYRLETYEGVTSYRHESFYSFVGKSGKFIEISTRDSEIKYYDSDEIVVKLHKPVSNHNELWDCVFFPIGRPEEKNIIYLPQKYR